MAEALGVSLGKTHYLLKAMIQKGFVKVENFRRHDQKIAYLYQLTPSGLAAKVEIAQAFLRRKEAEYEALRAEIRALRSELHQVPMPAANSGQVSEL
jgi:EPS-associated MarR family transcriptional regulator